MTLRCGEKPIGQAWFNFNPRFYLNRPGVGSSRWRFAFMFPVASVYKSFIREGPGAARVRRDLRVRGDLAVGSPTSGRWATGVGEGLKQERAAVAARQAAEAHRHFREEGGLAECQGLPADFGSIITSKTSFIDEIINGAQEQHLLPALRPGPAAASS